MMYTHAHTQTYFQERDASNNKAAPTCVDVLEDMRACGMYQNNDMLLTMQGPRVSMPRSLTDSRAKREAPAVLIDLEKLKFGAKVLS
jgi:hypothetical protein